MLIFFFFFIWSVVSASNSQTYLIYYLRALLLWIPGSLSASQFYYHLFCLLQRRQFLFFTKNILMLWSCPVSSDEFSVWISYLDRVLKIKLGEQSKVVFNCLVLWPIVLLSSCLSVCPGLYQNWLRFVFIKHNCLYYFLLEMNVTIVYPYRLMIYSLPFCYNCRF